jgi:DNA-binding LacI/PurR family transcriptional regulator
VLLTENLTYAFTDPGLVQFLRGVADEMSAAGMAMLLLPADADRDGALVRSAIVDAFIVCSIWEDDPAVQAVRSRRLPFVSSGSPRLPGAPYVGIDNARAAALAADHLLGLGHDRLGVVALPEDMPIEPSSSVVRVRRGFAQRVIGFLGRAAEAGIEAGAVAVVDAVTNSTEAGVVAGRELLARQDRPTAVFAVSDALALGVLVAADELGIDVPGSLSVIGFDNIDEAAHTRPGLTTVAQDLREQGGTAARMALQLVEGAKVRSAPRTPHVLVRGTTAAPSRTR